MREKLLNGALVILSLSAIVVTGIVVRREFFPAATRAAEIAQDPRWRAFARGGISLGEDSAPATIVVFSDFQCPFCRQLSPTIAQLQEKYSDRLRVVFHHFPLEAIHPYAREAALAAECAHERGRFSEMEAALFQNQSKLGTAGWGWFAMQAGIPDSASVNRCVAEARFADRIDADIKMGLTVPIEGTPTVFVNSLRLPGTPTYAIIDSILAVHLSDSPSR